MTNSKTILVTGATGQQGGATARYLLGKGFQVRAFVRNPNAPAAQQLANAGAKLIVGNMDERESLDEAMRDVHGVYSIQPSLLPPDFAENELQRGINVADAALAAGVHHVVFASVGSVDRNTGIPHWEIKWQVEQYIRKLGLPATFLRPTMFMENFADATWGPKRNYSVLAQIPPDEAVQLIALEDIGAMAALVFQHPERFIGHAIELAGDELTLGQILSAINHWTGVKLEGHAKPSNRAIDGNNGIVRYSDWQADIPALQAMYPFLMNFDTWLSRGGALKIKDMLAFTP
ncbi:NmrA/HSCARG family protein [Paenibacillus qinlingensis]|uniref:Uncharacterized protein YbjT (DUF2867 family) n=1 Tax=Paenibacillus qinlingensis TaxID=1837343 RepID=A0ABU1P168_9BACL|nr:NmrA/HSCARG family protein [Paenibacillus qinlingensis]MDR6553086.1 uncharacterized protein YbjT (DUF2867 family) [Paenibacillus qinlingensis]